MAKKRTSISVDEDVYEYLQRDGINSSGLINDLVRKARHRDKREVAALEVQLERLRDEGDELIERGENKHARADELEEVLNERKQEERQGLKEAREVLDDVPHDPDNPAVKNWADKLDMDETTLIDAL